MVLWRGVKSGPFASAKEGAVISDPGYGSTSTNREQAQIFSGTNYEPAMLRIAAPKGFQAADLRDFKGEQEIVLPRNVKYRVDEVIRREGRVPTILLTPMIA